MNTASDTHRPEEFPSYVVHLLGRRITPMTVSAIIDAIHQACRTKKRITVANYNINSFNLSMQLPWFYNFLQSSEITHCDGMGILKALKWMGIDLPAQYRASYTLLMPKLLQHCHENQLSVFLLGTKPEYLNRAIERLRMQYPGAVFSGHHGYFPLGDVAVNNRIVQEINNIQPNILIVGMGMPLQESWVYRHRSALRVNAILVGGAVIDRLAGVVGDCPNWISDLGLEWLYRLIREPKRLGARYLLGNPAFMLHIALAKFQQSLGSPKLISIKKNNDFLAESTPSSLLENEPAASLQMNGQKRLGDYLIEAGLITPSQIDDALIEQRSTGIRLGEILSDKGWIRQETIEFFVSTIVEVEIPSSPATASNNSGLVGAHEQ